MSGWGVPCLQLQHTAFSRSTSAGSQPALLQMGDEQVMHCNASIRARGGRERRHELLLLLIPTLPFKANPLLLLISSAFRVALPGR